MTAQAVGAPTGLQFPLESEGQHALVSEVGATLRSWHADDREQLDTSGRYDGKVLAPWPNRIRDGRYDGRQLEISEPERGAALHGLVLWSAWQPLRHTSDEVVLGHTLQPQPGYPFTLELEVGYRLTEAGLEATLRATNHSATAAPFGAGFHPAIAVVGPTLEVPARTRVPVDERLLPTGPAVPVDGSDYDFRRPRRPGALDTCFGGLERGADGLAHVRLATGERAVTVWMDEAFGFVHVFTSPTGIAVEPMTCAPDAFNSGDGLLALAPGGSFLGRWGVNTQREVQ